MLTQQISGVYVAYGQPGLTAHSNSVRKCLATSDDKSHTMQVFYLHQVLKQRYFRWDQHTVLAVGCLFIRTSSLKQQKLHNAVFWDVTQSRLRDGHQHFSQHTTSVFKVLQTKVNLSRHISRSYKTIKHCAQSVAARETLWQDWCQDYYMINGKAQQSVSFSTATQSRFALNFLTKVCVLLDHE